MKKLILAFLFGAISAALLLAVFGAASHGLGKTYSTIAIADTGTVSVPVAYCDEALLMLLGARGGTTTLDLDKSASVGTICNVSVLDNYDVTVKSTAAIFYDSTGTPNVDVVCTDDVGNDATGCFASFVKLSSGTWSLRTDPYGNWIW